jgi:hypothetical protein
MALFARRVAAKAYTEEQTRLRNIRLETVKDRRG